MIRPIFGFFIRDARQALSYKASLLLDIAKVLFKITTFYFIAKLVSFQDTGLVSYAGGHYFAYVLIGIAFATLQTTGLTAFSQSLRQEQYLGTLESILSTPIPLGVFLAGSALWDFVYAALEVILFFLFAMLLFGLAWPVASWGLAFIATGLAITSFMGLGIVAAAFILRYKKGNPIMLFLSAGSELLGSVYFPINMLPPWLQKIAAWMPMTHALKAIRASLLEGATWHEVQTNMLYLALFSVLVWTLGWGCFWWSLKKSREDGTLSHY